MRWHYVAEQVNKAHEISLSIIYGYIGFKSVENPFRSPLQKVFGVLHTVFVHAIFIAIPYIFIGLCRYFV